MIPSNRPSPNDALLQAVSEWAHRVAGCGAAKVKITLTDGQTITLAGLMERNPRLETGEKRTAGHVAEGWSFRKGYATWCGTEFPLTGKPHEILQFLAECRTHRATLSELRSEIWDDSLTEDRTVINAISALRSKLRTELGIEDDTIVLDGDRYILTLT